MAAKVFGRRVTEWTLKLEMEEYYGKDVTVFDVGHVAYDLRYAEGKFLNALAYINNVKDDYEHHMSQGHAITKCLIYNATGEPIVFVTSHDFYGRFHDFTFKSPHSEASRDHQANYNFVGSDDDDLTPRWNPDPNRNPNRPYPLQLENGQWAAFLHVKRPLTASGSSGAIVYRIKSVDKENDPDDDVDCMIAWSTGWGPWNTNHCYAEIRPKFHFNDAVWQKVETKMSNSRHHYVETAGYFRAQLNIRNDTELEAILTVGNPFQFE